MQSTQPYAAERTRERLPRWLLFAFIVAPYATYLQALLASRVLGQCAPFSVLYIGLSVINVAAAFVPLNRAIGRWL